MVTGQILAGEGTLHWNTHTSRHWNSETNNSTSQFTELIPVLVLQEKPNAATIDPEAHFKDTLIFDDKSEKNEVYEDKSHEKLKIQPKPTERMKINPFHAHSRKQVL